MDVKQEKQVLVSLDSTPDYHGVTEVEMTSNDLVWIWLPSVIEIPAKLDMGKFCTALSKTLAVHRPACGRIRKNSATDWKIVLTDSPLPVDVVESADLPQFSDASVSQPHKALQPYLPINKAAAHEVINADSPLLQMKITLSGEKTMIGVSWHHALGDLRTRFGFFVLLSRFYEGLDPVQHPPSFERHHFFDTATASEDAKQDCFSFIREIGGSPEIPLMTRMAQIFASGPMIPVSWIVSRKNANILRENMQKNLDLKVSVQDCLTAYVASAVQQCGYDIRRVSWMAECRGISPELANDAGNLITPFLTTFEDARDPRQVALKIRQGINAYRDPKAVTEGLYKYEQFLFSCTAKGDWNGTHQLAMTPNTVFSNPMASVIWQDSVNFGYTGARYHVPQNSITPFCSCIYPANPTAGRSAADAIEVVFAVPQSMHSQIMEKFEEKSYLAPFN